MAELLQGNERVTALFQENPFAEKPPKYIRAVRYRYEFTNFAEKRASGHWWRRELVDFYSPEMSLNE